MSEKRRRRLLVLSSTYPRWSGDHEPGFVHDLSRRLSTEFDVMVLCPHSPGAETYQVLDGVKVMRFRYGPMPFETLISNGGIIGNIKSNPIKGLMLPFFLIAELYAFISVCRSFKPEVVHAHWIVPQGVVAALSSIFMWRFPPLLITSHGSDLTSLKGRVLKCVKAWTVSRASSHTVVSNALKVEAMALGVPEHRIRTISMGVDLNESFTPDSSVQRSRHELLFVGRLVQGKGVDQLLRVLPKVLERYPDVRLTLIGDGPEKSEFFRLALSLNIVDQVSFLGAIPGKELPGYYRRAALFVAPFGESEGLGLVTIEALGCGCPVVTTDVPATREVLKGLRGVITVTPNDLDQLEQAISEGLEQSSARSEKIIGSLGELRDRFDWLNVARKYSELIAGLVNH